MESLEGNPMMNIMTDLKHLNIDVVDLYELQVIVEMTKWNKKQVVVCCGQSGCLAVVSLCHTCVSASPCE